jgi:hypothetical protein
MGTTLLAVALGVLRNVAEYRRQAMSAQAAEQTASPPLERWWRKWWRERKSGIKLSIGLWLLLFLYCFVKSSYDDFHRVDGERSTLTQQLSKLQDYAKHKDDYDKQLTWAQSETKHWQDAYQRAAKGDTDRKLSAEDESTLYDELARVGNQPINKSYAVLEIMVSCPKEAHRFGYQLLQIFKKAHWQVPDQPNISKSDLDVLSNSAVEGITIFTDDFQNHGQFLRFALLDAHINAEVIPFSQVIPHLSPKVKGTIVWVGER